MADFVTAGEVIDAMQTETDLGMKMDENQGSQIMSILGNLMNAVVKIPDAQRQEALIICNFVKDDVFVVKQIDDYTCYTGVDSNGEVYIWENREELMSNSDFVEGDYVKLAPVLYKAVKEMGDKLPFVVDHVFFIPSTKGWTRFYIKAAAATKGRKDIFILP